MKSNTIDSLMIPPFKGAAVSKLVNIESGNSKDYQLYNLNEDIGQQNNLVESKPDKRKEMIESFKALRGEDYSNTQQLKLK